MPIELFIDHRCTVNVKEYKGQYTFSYGGRKYCVRTQDEIHTIFLEKYPKLDTIHLRFQNEHYYLRFMLDQPEIYRNRQALRAELSQQSGGAWIEEKEGKKCFFIDKGWLISRPKKVTPEEFEKYHPSNSVQKAAAVMLGALAIGPVTVETARRIPIAEAMAMLALSRSSPGMGVLGVAIWSAHTAHAQTPTPTPIPPTSSQFRVNTNTTSDQLFSAVAGLTNGGFVAVWEGSQTGNYDIYGQRFDASGNALGSEFRINTNTTSSQDIPAVASVTNGGFIAVWGGLQTGGYDIYGQRYDVLGNALGSEFRINTNTTNYQGAPAVAGLTNGGFVVVWNGDQTGDYGIYGQMYDASGNALGSEFRINTNTTNFQGFPAVSGLTNGGFVTVWEGNQTGDYDIYGQRYDALGNALGSEFRINTNTTSSQGSSAVASLTDGGFVVVWNGVQTGDYDIYGQRYDASGNAWGSEFRINTNTTNYQGTPAVAGLRDGGFVVLWEGVQTGDYDIYGQRYDASGNALGSEFRINTNTTNYQELPSVAGLTDGSFAAVWDGYQTGDLDIYGQLCSNTSLSTSSTFSSTSPSLTSTPVQGSKSPTPSIASSQGISSMTPSAFIPSSSLPGFTSQSIQPSKSPTPSIASSQRISSMTPSSSIPSHSLPSSTPSSSTIIVPVYVLPAVESLVYDQPYPLYFNGQIIGSYTISGGVGLVQESSSNTILISLNAGIDLPDGTPIELFTVPNATGTWATTSSFLTSTECTRVDSSVTLKAGNPIYIVSTEHLCSPGAKQALIASILLT